MVEVESEVNRNDTLFQLPTSIIVYGTIIVDAWFNHNNSKSYVYF